MTQDFRFTSDRDAARRIEQYLNPLPRSVARSGTFALLDGTWRFALDLADRGLEERWYEGHNFSGTAEWPGSIEDHLAAGQSAAVGQPAWQDQVVAWYEREISVPPEWYDDGEQLAQLTFGACGYETRVWLNGYPLQTVDGEQAHFGGHTSFSYELPAAYLQPVSRLTVRIAHSFDAEIPRGKQESRVYRRGGIWYQTISGAVRSVWIEPVERNRLRTRMGVKSYIESQLVEFELTTRIHDPGTYTLHLAITPQDESQPVSVAEFPLRLEAGDKRQRVTMEVPGARLWSPEQPNLYHLTARLIDSRGYVSQIATHFGLRNIEARGQFIYLNDWPLYLDGILYQPGTANFEQMRRHLLAMKELGCNLVRVHIAGIDPRIYDLADELGMLLWVEVPSPHSSSQVSRANHWAELMRMLVVIGSHPSVIIWSLYNEDWGAEDIASSVATRDYIARTYDWMRLHVPQVLVVDNDGWNHVSIEGQLKADLLTAHIYTPELAEWADRLDRLAAGKLDEVAVKPLVVGDPFFYRGQPPLIVSEWGGFGFSDYGGPSDEAAKAERIRAFKAELRKRPIAGDVYTQAVSIEDEVNGLIDPLSGGLLVPPGVLASTPHMPADHRPPPAAQQKAADNGQPPAL